MVADPPGFSYRSRTREARPRPAPPAPLCNQRGDPQTAWLSPPPGARRPAPSPIATTCDRCRRRNSTRSDAAPSVLRHHAKIISSVSTQAWSPENRPLVSTVLLVAAKPRSRTRRSEEVGHACRCLRGERAFQINDSTRPRDSAGAPGGASPRPEPGAGSAGRDAAGAASINKGNSANQDLSASSACVPAHCVYLRGERGRLDDRCSAPRRHR